MGVVRSAVGVVWFVVVVAVVIVVAPWDSVGLLSRTSGSGVTSKGVFNLGLLSNTCFGMTGVWY